MPSVTEEDSKGFLAEDHANITNEEEIANVTLAPETRGNDTEVSFKDEKHDGIDKEEVNFY